MIETINFPICADELAQYGGWPELRQALDDLGLDGVEGIWGGEEPLPGIPQGILQGYHLTFFADWLDFYRNDTEALERKFGSVAAARAFFGGGPECLLTQYRADLARARALGARYVVFHVSDVSIEETYTYRWLHTDEAVIDASAELINAMLEGVAPEFDFLVENQWWPGFTFTEPRKTERLLEAIRYPRKGILLDTGHLMHCDTSITSQREGAAFLSAMLTRHGSLCQYIRGVHLHQSVSGVYVRRHTGPLPKDLPRDYLQRFAYSYAHIQRIDRHLPWTDAAIVPVLERIAPRYLTHELAVPEGGSRLAAAQVQLETLRGLRLPRTPSERRHVIHGAM